jgi:hypothetical protein
MKTNQSTVVTILFILLMLLIVGCSEEKKEWRKVCLIDSVTAYQSFIEKYPKYQFADSAKKRINQIVLKNGVEIDLSKNTNTNVEFIISNTSLTFNNQLVCAGMSFSADFSKVSVTLDSIAPSPDSVFALVKMRINNVSNIIQEVIADKIIIKTKYGYPIKKMVLLDYSGLLESAVKKEAYSYGIGTGEIKSKDFREWDLLLVNIPTVAANELILEYK